MVTALSYIGFTSPNAADWRTFGPDVLGAQLADDGSDGAVRLRLDDAVARIIVHPGSRDDLAYLGWDVGDAEGLAAAASCVRGAGLDVEPLEDLGLRGVDGGAAFVDPFGFRHELTFGLQSGAPFVPGRPMSGFLTGEQGLGHVVLIVPDLDDALRFYLDVLGFRLSDVIQHGGLDLRFLHCNQRHHTMALAGVPGMAGIHHLMVEVNEVDDVGRALDIVNEMGMGLAMSLGRHTNDHMTSFYVRTPSGFEIEYGTGGRLVDDATWVVERYDSTSFWGHKPPAAPMFPGILHAVPTETVA